MLACRALVYWPNPHGRPLECRVNPHDFPLFMQQRVGYELIYDCRQPTPMLLMLNIHHSRASDIVVPDLLTTSPSVPLSF